MILKSVLFIRSRRLVVYKPRCIKKLRRKAGNKYPVLFMSLNLKVNVSDDGLAKCVHRTVRARSANRKQCKSHNLINSEAPPFTSTSRVRSHHHHFTIHPPTPSYPTFYNCIWIISHTLCLNIINFYVGINNVNPTLTPAVKMAPL